MAYVPPSLESDTDCRVPNLRTTREFEGVHWPGTGLSLTRIYANETLGSFALHLSSAKWKKFPSCAHNLRFRGCPHKFTG